MSGEKILIVDDDDAICTLLETILKMENYQTASVTEIDDEGIIALLDREKPQLLILDFHLQSQDTLVYLPVIRANQTWQDMAILMTSGLDQREICLAAGADEFLLKPFNWQFFTKTVKKMVL